MMFLFKSVNSVTSGLKNLNMKIVVCLILPKYTQFYWV